MLEGYDTSGCSRVRPGKSAKTHPTNRFGDHDPADCGRAGLVESLFTGKTCSGTYLRFPSAAGLQRGLRHLDARSRVAEASAEISEISLQRVLSRLGAGWRVGTHQDAKSLWREHLP